MKISIARRAATFALIGATALLMAACSSVKLDDTDGANGSGSGKFGSQPWNDPSSPLFEKSVYFGFDEYTVQTKYQKMLSAHASYLKANPKQKIIIQDKAIDFKQSLDTAIQMGWLVHSVTVNSETNYWLAVLYREDK